MCCTNWYTKRRLQILGNKKRGIIRIIQCQESHQFLVGSFIKVFQKYQSGGECGREDECCCRHRSHVFFAHIIELNRIPPRLDSYKKLLFLLIHSSYWSCHLSQLEGTLNWCLFECVRIYTCLLNVYKRNVSIATSVIENPALAITAFNKLNRHRYVLEDAVLRT